MTFYLSSLASPVHIVGSSNSQMVQPSKFLNMLPKPSETKGSVLSHMGNLTGTQEKPRVIPPSSGKTFMLFKLGVDFIVAEIQCGLFAVFSR